MNRSSAYNEARFRRDNQVDGKWLADAESTAEDTADMLAEQDCTLHLPEEAGLVVSDKMK